MNFSTTLWVLTATTTALVAGLFYGYSVSVNPGLHALSNVEYLKAMQSINRAILNPSFFVCFLGSLFLLPATTYLQYSGASSVSFWLLIGATLLYATGVMGVTVLGNVPLNEALDKIDLQQITANEMESQRIRFEKPWNQLHNIRTFASVISFILVILSGILRSYK